ncbi:hypothetical protein [Dyadobacter diqingensis]|uniref:hypothetical protein n=1 Tax=Dyadobacter diqingensis TaxID=2938121 RepID=UPI0020C19E6E|nr:hypothetical protein [Dyadobacter diqingensis]
MKILGLLITLSMISMLSCKKNNESLGTLRDYEHAIRNLSDTTDYDIVVSKVQSLSDSIRLAAQIPDDSLNAMLARVMNWGDELSSEKKAYWEMQSCFRPAFKDSIDAGNCLVEWNKILNRHPNAFKRKIFQDNYDATAAAYIELFCIKRKFYGLDDINSAVITCMSIASTIQSVFRKQQTNIPLNNLYEQRRLLFNKVLEYKITELEIAMADSINRYFITDQPDFEMIGMTEAAEENYQTESILLPLTVTKNYNIIATDHDLLNPKKLTYPIRMIGVITGSVSTPLNAEIKQVMKGDIKYE